MADQHRSGEVVLASLLDFFDKSQSDIVRGTVTVRLHPRALEYLALRLQTLQDLDHLKRSSPVEFFRGAFADVDDYSHLQKLQQTVASIRRLCISSTVHHLRDPTRVNLQAFKSLTHLELRSCDLSTSAWLGHANVSSKLESLICIGCLEELRHLLAPFSSAFSVRGSTDGSEDDVSDVWPKLTRLVCKENSLSEMDEILSLKTLKSLDLSSNNINSILNIQECTALTELNLSHNNIEHLQPLREGPSSLARLILQGNAVKSIRGLSGLTALTELDLRCNLLASYQEFDQLHELSSLRLLWLEGNPLAYAPFYRLDVLSWFPGPLLKLDGVGTRKEEREAVGLRAAGQIPVAWKIMAEYVGQRELLWRPPNVLKQVPSEESLPLWRASSLRASPMRHLASPSRQHLSSPSRQRTLPPRRSVPARRIVEFSGDPLAALEESLERPPSPSPFHPWKEDFLETASQSSASSAVHPRTLSGWDRNVQTVYRGRSDQNLLPPGLPSAASSKTLSKQDVKPPTGSRPEVWQGSQQDKRGSTPVTIKPLNGESEDPEESPKSDTSSSLATSVSSTRQSLDQGNHRKTQSAELEQILRASSLE